MDDTWLTVPEAARTAGRSTMSVYRWMRKGRLTRYKTGTGATVISRSELAALLTPEPKPAPVKQCSGE